MYQKFKIREFISISLAYMRISINLEKKDLHFNQNLTHFLIKKSNLSQIFLWTQYILN